MLKILNAITRLSHINKIKQKIRDESRGHGVVSGANAFGVTRHR